MDVLALARLGQVDEARRRVRAGLAAAIVELGALRRRSGSRRAAEDELRAGLDLAGRLGATRLVERARAELLAMGRRPRCTALTGLDALTGSERRVADPATQDLTNKGIAESLFITTRTVEIHMSSAYRRSRRLGRKDAAYRAGWG
jgi:DNA-binding NarL/FixJ family response regulator